MHGSWSYLVWIRPPVWCECECRCYLLLLNFIVGLARLKEINILLYFFIFVKEKKKFFLLLVKKIWIFPKYALVFFRIYFSAPYFGLFCVNYLWRRKSSLLCHWWRNHFSSLFFHFFSFFFLFYFFYLYSYPINEFGKVFFKAIKYIH